MLLNILATRTSTKTVDVNQAVETDSAQTIVWAPKNRFVNLVLESDSSFTIGHIKIGTIGQAQETDSAFAIRAGKIRTIGQALETDTAQPVAWAPKNRFVNQALETDTAQAMKWAPKMRFVNQVLETDSAQPITGSTSGGGGTAIQTINRRKWHRSGS